MGNNSSAPQRSVKPAPRSRDAPKRCTQPGSNRPQEMHPADRGRMQAVAIMTSRRTRAETLGRLVLRDPTILTSEPVDRDSYLMWASHFPLAAVMKKSDELLCSDPDLADAYHQLVRSAQPKLTQKDFWLRYYYAQIRVHEDEQILEANNSHKRQSEQAAATTQAATAVLCGRVQLSVQDRVSGVKKAEKDVIRFVERTEMSEDPEEGDEGMPTSPTSPTHLSSAALHCGMITERTREAADDGISLFLKEAEEEALRQEATLRQDATLLVSSSDSDTEFDSISPRDSLAADRQQSVARPAFALAVPALNLDAQAAAQLGGEHELLDEELDTSRSMYEL